MADYDKVLALADHIDKLPTVDYADPLPVKTGGRQLFDQTRWSHFCNSPACIAGWTVFLFEPDEWEAVSNIDNEIYNWAVRILDLTTIEAARLFDGAEATAQQAAWTLRNFAKTNRVVWNIREH